MYSERRRVPRYAFGGAAEISAAQPSLYIIGPTVELSRFGCFVATKAQVGVGTRVSLKITYDGNAFNATGLVSHVLPEKGIGLGFVPSAPEDEAVLEEWLRQIVA